MRSPTIHVWAIAGTVLAIMALLAMCSLPTGQERRTNAAVATIRTIATLPVVEKFSDTTGDPQIIVHLPALDNNQAALWIARAIVDRRTNLLDASFETEVRPGQVWGETHPMTPQAFAHEIERRALVMKALEPDAVAATEGRPYDRHSFDVVRAQPCRTGGHRCRPKDRAMQDRDRPHGAWALTDDGRFIVPSASTVARIRGE